MGKQLPIKRSCSEISEFAHAIEVLIVRSDLVPKYTSGALFKI